MDTLNKTENSLSIWVRPLFLIAIHFYRHIFARKKLWQTLSIEVKCVMVIHVTLDQGPVVQN